MNHTKLKLQTDDPGNPVIDPDKSLPPDSLPEEDPNPYPVSDPIPDVEPVPKPPETNPQYPPDVVF